MMPEAGAAPGAEDVVLDAIIIGAGLAGSTAAFMLAKAGRKVALIDVHAVYPHEFRAEKLGARQFALFEEVGLGEVVRPLLTPMDDSLVYRFGRPVSRKQAREYGFDYATLINGLRKALPAEVHLVTGKVAELSAGPELQNVVLADGASFRARLLVLATGHGDAVRRSVGIRRIEAVKAHSLSLGFTLAHAAAAYAFENLTYYGRDPADRLAYITMFPIGDEIRANLFVYRTVIENWTKEFRQKPEETLKRMMPEIADLCGDFAIKGRVEIRQIDLLATEGYRRDGVVLLGDAFITTCPVPGVGMMRVLTDVSRLCRTHLPNWLATPGMSEAKINAFYDDPVKQAMDAKGLNASLYARSVTTGAELKWAARRCRNNLARRLFYWASATGEALRAKFGRARPKHELAEKH